MRENDETTAVQVVDGGVLAVMERAQIDMQIATARKYGRNEKANIERAIALATMDPEIAETCTYSLKRWDAKKQKDVFIKGESVRCAEIVATTWEHLRVGARIVDIAADHVEAYGMCHDLLNNFCFGVTVNRSIMTSPKTGDPRRFTQDMIMVTCAAACAIAKRNAILGVIPRALVKKVYDAAMANVIPGDKTKFYAKVNTVIEKLCKMGTTAEKILAYLDIETVEQIGPDLLEALIGIGTRIKDKEITIDVFDELDPFEVETGTITPADLKPAEDQTIRPGGLDPKDKPKLSRYEIAEELLADQTARAKEEAAHEAIDALGKQEAKTLGAIHEAVTTGPESAPTPPWTEKDVLLLSAEITELRVKKGVTGRVWMTQWKKMQTDMTPPELVAVYKWLRAMPDKEENTDGKA